MDTPETAIEVVVRESAVDRCDGEFRHKSNLKRNVGLLSKQTTLDSSCPSDSDAYEGGGVGRRVSFRDTIEVFSDGEEAYSVPLNDDFAAFPSLRSPLKRLGMGRPRARRRPVQASDDLYVVGELYGGGSDVPIVFLKRSLRPSSVDLIAPLATMDDMDLYDEDSDDRWMDEEDADCFTCAGGDDLSAESDSEEIDEVMEMLLREKCLSDEEDQGLPSPYYEDRSEGEEEEEEEYEEEEGEVGVAVDIVRKESTNGDDFFDEANIEEIESSSSTDSVADSDHLNGVPEEGRDVLSHPMHVIPEEHFWEPREAVDLSPPQDNGIPLADHQEVRSESRLDSPVKARVSTEGKDQVCALTCLEIQSPVPSRASHGRVCEEAEFRGAATCVARSKSVDFKEGTDGCSLEARARVNSMVDSGFASLEMSDLESKLTASPTGRGPIESTKRITASSDDRPKVEESPLHHDDEFSCSLDSNVSSLFINSSPEELTKFCEFESHKESVSADLISAPPDTLSKTLLDYSLGASPSKAGTKPKSELKREGVCPVSVTSAVPSSVHPLQESTRILTVELLPILTWIFTPPG